MKKVRNILSFLIFILIVIILLLLNWYNDFFTDTSFEQILFHMTVPLKDTSNSVISDFFKYEMWNIITCLFIIIIYILYCSNIFRHSYTIEMELFIKNKKKVILKNINDDRNYILGLNIILLLIVIAYGLKCLNFKEYVYNNINTTNIYKEYYVNPKNVNITFPKQKRNLIYIYLESMESSYSNLDEDVLEVRNIIPNLTNLAENNISFSNTESLGGAYNLSGTGWTVDSMVGQTAGIPVKIPIDGNYMGNFKTIFPGAYTLGDVLYKNGYDNYLLLGSRSSYGGKKDYFMQHGNYKVHDYDWAMKNEVIPEDYEVNWGIEDYTLINIAKKELLELSKNDKPFSYSILTTDTHFPEGWQDDTCDHHATSNIYATSILCNDKKISDFIKWIKKQDFYKNTTIVLVGDHYTMGNYLFYEGYDKDRKIYNAIINSAITTKNTKNREFTVLDLYPTTLASLGVEISGNKLGLGVNLFSDEKTLPEKLSYDYFDDELQKKSNYYNKEILLK